MYEKTWLKHILRTYYALKLAELKCLFISLAKREAAGTISSSGIYP